MHPPPDFVALLLEQAGPSPTPADVVGALVPEVVDLAQVFVAVDGALHLVSYRHIDPEFHPILEELARVHRPRLDHPTDPVAHVVRSGTPAMSRWIERRDVERATGDVRVHQIFDAIRPRNIIIVPLGAHERAFGAIVVAVSSSSRRLIEADLALMASFGQKVGQVLRVE
jgi:hypothetical protein